jgi:spermidine/putrescine-binding protein
MMKAALKTPFERMHLLLAVGLLAACAANLALVAAWLAD